MHGLFDLSSFEVILFTVFSCCDCSLSVARRSRIRKGGILKEAVFSNAAPGQPSSGIFSSQVLFAVCLCWKRRDCK